jgi:prepilin-type processing-associated H-X9-DG protein
MTLLRDAMPGTGSSGPHGKGTNPLGMPYEPPRHGGGNNFAFVDGHVQWLRFPGGHERSGGDRWRPVGRARDEHVQPHRPLGDDSDPIVP